MPKRKNSMSHASLSPYFTKTSSDQFFNRFHTLEFENEILKIKPLIATWSSWYPFPELVWCTHSFTALSLTRNLGWCSISDRGVLIQDLSLVIGPLMLSHIGADQSRSPGVWAPMLHEDSSRVFRVWWHFLFRVWHNVSYVRFIFPCAVSRE